MSIVERFAKRITNGLNDTMQRRAAAGTQEGAWGLGAEVAKIIEKRLPVYFDQGQATVHGGGDRRSEQKMIVRHYEARVGENFGFIFIGEFISGWQTKRPAKDHYTISISTSGTEDSIPRFDDYWRDVIIEVDAFLASQGMKRGDNQFALTNISRWEWRKDVEKGLVDMIDVGQNELVIDTVNLNDDPSVEFPPQ